MFSHKKRAEAVSTELPPTIRYFIERAKGNTDLANLIIEAKLYVESNDPKTPADKYFLQLIANSTSRGIIPLYMRSDALTRCETEAIKYCEQFAPVSSARLSNT